MATQPVPALYDSDDQVRIEIAETRRRADFRERAHHRAQQRLAVADGVAGLRAVLTELPANQPRLVALHKLDELVNYALASISQDEADDLLMESNIGR